MNGEDELRARIARLDPMAEGVQTESVHPAPTRALMETIMTTPTPSPQSTDQRSGNRFTRGPLLLGAAAAALVVVGIGVALAGGGDGDDGDNVAIEPTVDTAVEVETAADEGGVLELSTGETDPLMMSCIAITPELVADVPVAFKATASAVEADQVTLAITEWYKGGDAATATLTAPPGLEALIAGFAFEVGQEYLITAFDGVVNYCGFSGPAVPELQAIFDQAFD